MKVWNETKKILGDEDAYMTCTAVRVPVMGGHSESVYLEFEHPFELHEVRQKLADFPGVVVQDEPAHNRYPMPLTAVGKNEVFVGRIRRDLVNERPYLWVVADNLRKGAATNTVQIAHTCSNAGVGPGGRLVSITCALSCVANGSRSHHNQVFLRCAKRSDSLGSALLIACAGLCQTSAQTQIKGTVIDAETGDALPGASVFLEESRMGAVSDYEGRFAFSDQGRRELSWSLARHRVRNPPTSLHVGADAWVLDLGPITMQSSTIGLSEANVIASVAIDRETPVAVSTLDAKTIQEQLGQGIGGNVEHHPRVYATKSGGGFGDSRINIRGFDQRNVAVLINGIPVNDMENGWVYWSNGWPRRRGEHHASATRLGRPEVGHQLRGRHIEHHHQGYRHQKGR